ncbi:F420-dependent methylenetetrahydromethanopterin dehydrogenase [archaeon]|nr:F420-dependent methylenetetrahydromethanopterin dehydrogenase [archaeon]
MWIGVIKTGNIASSLVLELLLDERADRKNIDVRVATSGAKMGPDDCTEVAKQIIDWGPELILYTTPNPATPGPAKVIEMLSGHRAIVVGDAPGIKIKDKLDEAGIGYIFVKADSMIGARREFLDPTEMAIFNGDMLKVLGATGALKVIQEAIDRAINDKNYLPKVIIDSDTAVARSGIKNPYARAKAKAAYEMAEKVGELNVKGCFMQKDPKVYIQTVASAHELLRAAAALADEAREMEKAADTVDRRPHAGDGKTLKKEKLKDKPQ